MASRKIDFFQQAILRWYIENGRNFSWRRPGLSVYEYIIAEVLLQRTRAETVQKFYQQFVQRFPSWTSITNTSLTGLELALQPVGLYRQRAKRLQGLAEEMVRREGKFPGAREELEQVPFMGQYIANAVELFVFSRPKPLLDVNMARVLERVFKPRVLADIRYDPYLQKLAAKIVAHPRARDINWAVLDHAALVCQIKNPKCAICPINTICNFFKKNKF